jgi:hypothetical protein
MTDKKEILADVGKYVAKEAAKIVAADMKGSGELVGAAKELNDTLNEVVAKHITCKLQVFRIDPMNPTIERYVCEINNVNPALLLEQGLESTIQKWCGGGRYKIKIQAEGIKEKTQTVEIEGEALAPLPDRLAKGGQIPGNALSATGTPGQYTAGPGFAGLLGFPNPQAPAGETATNKALGSMENVTSILLAKMLGGDMQQRSSQESDELKKANELIAELKREKDLAVAQAAHQKEMADLNAKLEKLMAAQERPPQEGTLEKVLAVAATAIPAMLAAKASSDQAQTQLMIAMMNNSNKDDGSKNALLQAFLAKPSETDQMMKMYEAIGGMMGTSVQLTQGIINQMASLQGGEQRTWWQEAVLNLSTSLGDVAQAALSRSKVVSGEIVDVEPEDDDEPQLEDAASAAAAAAQQQMTDGAQPQQLAGYVGPSRKDPRYAADSITKIFRLIEEDASPNDIAFRVWKTATSGHPEALAWVRDPEGYTAQLLLSFVQRREMVLTEERYDAVLAAMVDLHEHFANGGTAEAYIAHFGIKQQPPKVVHVVPIERQQDEAEPAEVAPEAPVAAVVEPPVETAPTPGFDRLPHPSHDVPVVPVTGPDRLPSPTTSPMPSASENIALEPKA